jgi:hypothetical protein
MHAPADHDRSSRPGASSLEEEVVLWRRKRALRPREMIGSVRVVRIPRRGSTPLGRLEGHTLRSTAP